MNQKLLRVIKLLLRKGYFQLPLFFTPTSLTNAIEVYIDTSDNIRLYYYIEQNGELISVGESFWNKYFENAEGYKRLVISGLSKREQEELCSYISASASLKNLIVNI